MKCVHLFAVVLLSMFLVECIHSAPHKQGVNDLKPVFRDDTFVLSESNAGQEVSSTDVISKYFKALPHYSGEI